MILNKLKIKICNMSNCLTRTCLGKLKGVSAQYTFANICAWQNNVKDKNK